MNETETSGGGEHHWTIKYHYLGSEKFIFILVIIHNILLQFFIQFCLSVMRPDDSINVVFAIGLLPQLILMAYLAYKINQNRDMIGLRGQLHDLECLFVLWSNTCASVLIDRDVELDHCTFFSLFPSSVGGWLSNIRTFLTPPPIFNFPFLSPKA